ncbi:MAG: phytanoyl-CoA dioxygenase [Boseongicola sp.]|nr:MAG: phytanoyl-CoA dioxygenase [Boseongicola sp.]
MNAPTKSLSQQVWLDATSGDFDAFKRDMDRTTDIANLPNAAEVQQNIPIYDGETVRNAAKTLANKLALMAEWNQIFDKGAGVIAIKNAMPDLVFVDQATEVFNQLIEAERATGAGGGDHFAKPGANDRVWNAAQKHCLANPENFAAYFASDAIAMASRAWLGRGYQVTAQVNRVNPGGAAQTPHRDYHLGFMTPDQLATYPVQAHITSPSLTLQGAVAHCDMPLESGPTMLLPYSQSFRDGYVAFGRPEFQQYFAENHAQLALEKGDAVFFNPALMHGAGNNVSTDIYRMANLLQIGSAFGRSIETVNRTAMAKALYPVLQNTALSAGEIANVIAASAEGYAFPTNLDRDPPVGGLIPKSQAERMEAAIDDNMPVNEFNEMLDAYDTARST